MKNKFQLMCSSLSSQQLLVINCDVVYAFVFSSSDLELNLQISNKTCMGKEFQGPARPLFDVLTHVVNGKSKKVFNAEDFP